MKQERKDFFVQKVKELMNAHSCCEEAKKIAQNWLNAIGTEKEKEAAEKLIVELEEDIMPIDNLITFSASDLGVEIFGKEMAQNILNHAKEIKAAGAKYCDCDACTAVAEILERKEELL